MRKLRVIKNKTDGKLVSKNDFKPLYIKRNKEFIPRLKQA